MAQSNTQEVIAILGSTGVQGASVLHHLLATVPAERTLLRAITHSSPSAAAPALPPLSAHPNLSIHQADILQEPSLVEAFTGARAVFANTNSQDPRFAETGDQYSAELQAIKNIVNACVKAEVEYLILSSLSDLGFLSHRCWDFRAKSEGMSYAREVSASQHELKGLKGLKVIFPQLGWYMNNFVWWHPGVPNAEDGVVEFEIPGADPDMRVPWVSTYADLGPVVKGLLDNPVPYLGAEILVAGDLLNLHEIVATYTKVTGQASRVVSRTPIIPASEEFPGPETTLTKEELQAAYFMAIYNSGKYLGSFKPGESDCDRLMATASQGEQKMTTWEQWLRQTGYNAKEDGFGAFIKERGTKWGGRRYF